MPVLLGQNNPCGLFNCHILGVFMRVVWYFFCANCYYLDESADENIIVTISESEFDVDGSDCDLKVAIVNQKIKILQVFCERCIHKLKWKKVDDDSYMFSKIHFRCNWEVHVPCTW